MKRYEPKPARVFHALQMTLEPAVEFVGGFAFQHFLDALRAGLLAGLLRSKIELVGLFEVGEDIAAPIDLGRQYESLESLELPFRHLRHGSLRCSRVRSAALGNLLSDYILHQRRNKGIAVFRRSGGMFWRSL